MLDPEMGQRPPHLGQVCPVDLAAGLGTDVDVVDLDRAPLELRGRVAERGRVLFSAAEARRVGFAVAARLRWSAFRPVRDYGDAFRVLAEEGVLEGPLAERMVALAGARNLIVHLYAEVDDARLARAVREGGLDDLSAFAAAVAALALR